MGCGCNCGNTNKKMNLIYACSGAANTGKLSDQAARVLAIKKAGMMTCLAAVGANLSGFIESAKAADNNIILDGCAVSCGKKIFEKAGIENYTQYLMTDFGVEKEIGRAHV